MKGQLIIPIGYKGEQLELRSKLSTRKYGYQFWIKLGDGEVVIEPDQQRMYNVGVKPGRLLREGKIDEELVQVIKGVVEKTVK